MILYKYFLFSFNRSCTIHRSHCSIGRDFYLRCHHRILALEETAEGSRYVYMYMARHHWVGL